MRSSTLIFLALAYSVVKASAQDDTQRFYDDPWFYAMTASMTADLVTTEIGLSRGLNEGNVVVQRRAVRYPLRIGLTLLTYHYARKAERTGHPRWANFLRTTSLTANLYATGWNVAVIVSR